MVSLEICVDSVESAVAAAAGGAQRVELCSALLEGGLTPSLGLIRAVRARIGIGVHVMIRPRGGDFLYSADECSIMRDDIALAAQAGADGVVLGLLTVDGDIDVERTREMVELARPLAVTFHRALDVARDLEHAFAAVLQTGVTRVLTSGGAPTAREGRHRLREFVRLANAHAADRGTDPVEVMAGGGVRAENVAELVEGTGIRSFHAALRHPVESPVKHKVHEVHLGARGLDNYARAVVRAEDVRLLRATLDKMERTRAERESALA